MGSHVDEKIAKKLKIKIFEKKTNKNGPGNGEEGATHKIWPVSM